MITHRLVTVTFTVPVDLCRDPDDLQQYMRQAIHNDDYVQMRNPTFEELGTPPEIAATIER